MCNRIHIFHTRITRVVGRLGQWDGDVMGLAVEKRALLPYRLSDSAYYSSSLYDRVRV